MRFAANVDGADVADAIEGLNPKRTLLIVASKTFTTQETLANAEFVRAWGPARIAAATAAPEKAVAWGVAAEDVFPFWDWVGGRYSLWSSVSLVCEIALTHGIFFRMLEGAEEMDNHFLDTPFAQNLPAISAAVQMWNREALGHRSYALIPYAERLRLLPTWAQQRNGIQRQRRHARWPTVRTLRMRGDMGRGWHQRAAFVLSAPSSGRRRGASRVHHQCRRQEARHRTAPRCSRTRSHRRVRSWSARRNASKSRDDRQRRKRRRATRLGARTARSPAIAPQP